MMFGNTESAIEMLSIIVSRDLFLYRTVDEQESPHINNGGKAYYKCNSVNK